MEQEQAGARTLCQFIVNSHEEQSIEIDIERLTMVLLFYQAFLDELNLEPYDMNIKNICGAVVSVVALEICAADRLSALLKVKDFYGSMEAATFKDYQLDCLTFAIGISSEAKTESLIDWFWSTQPMFDGCGTLDFREWKSRNRMGELTTWLREEGTRWKI